MTAFRGGVKAIAAPSAAAVYPTYPTHAARAVSGQPHRLTRQATPPRASFFAGGDLGQYRDLLPARSGSASGPTPT